MRVKFIIGALVVLLIMNIAAAGSFFYLHHHEREYHEGDRMHRWVLKNVPEKDREKFFRTVRTVHQDIGPLADSTSALEQQLINSMRQDPVPHAHIDSLLEQISRNRLEIARRATSRMIAMGDSLTPDERGHMVDAILRFRKFGKGDPWSGK
jgi:uncharacterized membrane protein